MSEEHLERIEAKLDRVIAIQGDHTLTLAQHTSKLNEHSKQFERLDTRFDGVAGTLTRLDTRMGAVEGTLVRQGARMGAVEEALARQETRLTSVEISLETTVPYAIKQIAEGHAMLQGSMDRGFDEVKKHIDDRLVPLEETVRQHSATLRTLSAGR